MKTFFNISKKIIIASVFFGCFFSTNEALAKTGEIKCRMNFTLKSWSFFYKSGKGTGYITCNNGQKASVNLRGQGGGFTIGKSKIINGLGVFSGVSDIKELYGNYANAEAHAGVVNSASARALTKGEVSLTLTGTGQGVDLGINIGNFKISKK